MKSHARGSNRASSFHAQSKNPRHRLRSQIGGEHNRNSNNSFVIPPQFLTYRSPVAKIGSATQVVARLGTNHSSVVLVGSNPWRSHHWGFIVLIVACLDQEGHALPSTAASLASSAAHLHASRLSVEGARGDGTLQVSEAMAWRSSREGVVLTESTVSLANLRPIIASSVDLACATPLGTLLDWRSESRREVASTVS